MRSQYTDAVERWYAAHPIIIGSIAFLMMIAPMFVGMQLGFSLLDRVWPAIADGTDKPWTIPYLLGFAVGGSSILVINRLVRTPVAAILAYADARLETIQYPMYGEGERDRDA